MANYKISIAPGTPKGLNGSYWDLTTIEDMRPLIPVTRYVVPAPAKRELAPAPKRKEIPSIIEMVTEAIKEKRSRGGVCYVSILRYIEANYPVDRTPTQRARLRRVLRKAVEKGLLVPGTKRFSYVLVKQVDKEAIKAKKLKLKEKKKLAAAKKLKAQKKKKKSVKKTSKKKVSPANRGKKVPGQRKKKVPVRKTPVVSKAKEGEMIHIWQYRNNSDGFSNYVWEASELVEGVYQEYMSSDRNVDIREVKSGQWSYMIDFRLMTQQNMVHQDHTSRKIRREQIPVSEKHDLYKNYPAKKGKNGEELVEEGGVFNM